MSTRKRNATNINIIITSNNMNIEEIMLMKQPGNIIYKKYI